jgi:hypothetical protein
MGKSCRLYEKKFMYKGICLFAINIPGNCDGNLINL